MYDGCVASWGRIRINMKGKRGGRVRRATNCSYFPHTLFDPAPSTKHRDKPCSMRRGTTNRRVFYCILFTKLTPRYRIFVNLTTNTCALVLDVCWLLFMF